MMKKIFYNKNFPIYTKSSFFKISNAINWILAEMDPSKSKAPFIQNIKSERKTK